MSPTAKEADKAQYEKERLEHTPWVEKYRPKSLDDIAAQDHAVHVLKKTVASANLPHMLFYGSPGTGKTSTILALAMQLYGPRLFRSRVLELNASDERGIAIVRDKIKRFARLSVSNPSPQDLAEYPCPPYKIIILDEADSMTNDAQSALRRTMETYSGVTRFCLVCNYITRIIDPLASRCSKFRFRRLDNEHALGRLLYITSQEHISLAENEPVLEEVLSIAKGDLRKAITYLQSAAKLSNSLNSTDEDVSMVPTPITIDTIREIAGVVPESVITSLVQAISSRLNQQIADSIAELAAQGWSGQQLLDQLHDKYLLDDSLLAQSKNQIALDLFAVDMRLQNGTDEQIQLLGLCLKIAQSI